MIQRLVIVLTIMGLTHNELLKLTCNEIKKFVDGHNTRRLQVAKGKLHGQPAAAVINSVNWDEELAAKAKKWASTEPLIHNPDKKIASRRFRTGENIYWSISSEPTATLDPETVLSKWFAEHEMYNYSNGLDSPYTVDGGTSHYTQMVWSNSTYIGCAIAKTLFQKMTKFTVVCNYGPAGNKLGEVPYTRKMQKRGSKTLSCGIADCSKLYGEKCSDNTLRLTFDLRITN